jgi:hypothetical protein
MAKLLTTAAVLAVLATTVLADNTMPKSMLGNWRLVNGNEGT